MENSRARARARNTGWEGRERERESLYTAPATAEGGGGANSARAHTHTCISARVCKKQNEKKSGEKKEGKVKKTKNKKPISNIVDELHAAAAAAGTRSRHGSVKSNGFYPTAAVSFALANLPTVDDRRLAARKTRVLFVHTNTATF